MRRVSLITVIAAVAALTFVAVTGGAVRSRVHASMSARQVVPPLTLRGTGTFSGTIRKSGRFYALRWSLSYRRLTSAAIAAQIRLGTAGHDGKVLLALCRPCRVAAGGLRRISPTVRRALMGGRAYVVVETRRHPNGEIRGQVLRGR